LRLNRLGGVREIGCSGGVYPYKAIVGEGANAMMSWYDMSE